MEVIDNFLPEDLFNPIQKLMMGTKFPWFYNSGILHPNEPDRFQFAHFFWLSGHDSMSDHLVVLDPCLVKLGVVKDGQLVGDLRRIKANLTTQTSFNKNTGFHIDYPRMKTSIFYVNTNDGYTEFRDGSKVSSIANRMVIFDSDLEHAGFTCTDEQNRVVVNFNYTEL